MLRVKLSPAKIISFDGEVVELFDDYLEDSRRVHVAHIKTIAVEPDRKGTPTISLTTGALIVRLPFEAELAGKVEGLVAAVRQAMEQVLQQ